MRLKQCGVGSLFFSIFILIPLTVFAGETDFKPTKDKSGGDVKPNLYGDIEIIGNSVLECEQAFYSKKEGVKSSDGKYYDQINISYMSWEKPNKITFQGYLRIPEDGHYTFQLETNQEIAIHFDDEYVQYSYHKGSISFSENNRPVAE